MAKKFQRRIEDMRFLLFVGISFFIAAPLALAQTTQVQFGIYPEAPGPNQTVVIEAQGVGGVLGGAFITWQLNGKTVLSGTGERQYSFTTGSVGSQTRVRVVIESSSLGTITREFTFAPGLVHLIWESNTTAPVLYRGKSLYSAGSQIKVVAVPQIMSGGSFVSSNSLSFQWRVNDDLVASQSGLGRTTLTFTGSQLHTAERIGLDVYLAGVPVGHAELIIPAVDPQLALYVKDPLRGVLYDQALPGAVSLEGREVTLKAEPYHFASNSLTSGLLSYTWKLNGQTVTGPDSANGILTLRQTGSGQGQGSLVVELQNLDTSKLIQAATARLRLLFGQQVDSGSGSAFGL